MSCPNFKEFCVVVAKKNPFQEKFVHNSTKDMTSDCREDGEAYIKYCLGLGESIEDLADAYLGFVDVMNGEQLYFAREDKYRYKSLAEVEDIVYKNPDYMKMYMRGLGLTMFLWPQHQQTRAFFQSKLPSKNRGKLYMEVGPGHGMFFLHALRKGGFDKCIGVDISPTSIATTQSLLDSGLYGELSPFELICADFLDYAFEGKLDTIVIGEVLEHVETPEKFIKKIADSAAPDGFIFLSTCLNAAALDHIYNFETLEQLEALFDDADLKITERLLIPYTGKTTDLCLRKRFPMNVAYILQPQ